MHWISKDRFREAWNKYGLIVVGNIVFFILLYFISYRPHNTENRSMDLLSFAQSAENKGRHETAVDLYEKIITDYEGTRAAQTAAERIPELKNKLSANRVVPPDCPARCEDLNLEEMLRKEPTLYVATHMAKHYERYPDDREKIKEIIIKNLKVAHEWSKISIEKLKGESEFQSKEMQQAFFDLRPECIMKPDLIYDDFEVKNANFFTWTNVTIELTVSQGQAKKNKLTRNDKILADQNVDMLEFRVKKDGGPVTCLITIKSDQGRIEISQEI